MVFGSDLLLPGAVLLGVGTLATKAQLPDRILGQGERANSVGISDPEWPFRDVDPETARKELTRTPVRITNDHALKEPVHSSVPIRLDALVVGGAAAGLSSAACLKARGVSCLVIEKNENCGDIWASRCVLFPFRSGVVLARAHSFSSRRSYY